jgi:signal transduction histidine kinase
MNSKFTSIKNFFYNLLNLLTTHNIFLIFILFFTSCVFYIYLYFITYLQNKNTYISNLTELFEISFNKNDYNLIDEYENNKNTLNQMFIFNISIFIANFSFMSIFIRKLYLQNVNLSEYKYNETKKLMTYVNHELRNPLNIIYGLSQTTDKKIINIINSLILNQHTTNNNIDLTKIMNINSALINFPHEHHKKAFESLREIYSNIMTIHNSSRMASIIVNDVLDLQKLEDNRMIINKTNFTSIDLTNDIYKSISYKINEYDSFIKTLFFIDPNISFHTDKNRLIQIIVNLYTNSVKFTKNGNITIIIKYDDSENIIISVTDSGIGISENIKDNIFKKPFICNKSTVNSIGIGLYISSMIAKILNFDLSFVSKINIGTTFTIKINNTFLGKTAVQSNPLSHEQIIDKITIIDSCDYNKNH